MRYKKSVPVALRYSWVYGSPSVHYFIDFGRNDISLHSKNESKRSSVCTADRCAIKTMDVKIPINIFIEKKKKKNHKLRYFLCKYDVTITLGQLIIIRLEPNGVRRVYQQRDTRKKKKKKKMPTNIVFERDEYFRGQTDQNGFKPFRNKRNVCTSNRRTTSVAGTTFFGGTRATRCNAAVPNAHTSHVSRGRGGRVRTRARRRRENAWDRARPDCGGGGDDDDVPVNAAVRRCQHAVVRDSVKRAPPTMERRRVASVASVVVAAATIVSQMSSGRCPSSHGRHYARIIVIMIIILIVSCDMAMAERETCRIDRMSTSLSYPIISGIRGFYLGGEIKPIRMCIVYVVLQSKL